ncbi:MAG: ribose-5-phosphate isomerase RpiA [candidate division Zixibacteria bacterium]|nr:ribose-5-phosphate isomerase RpiA [candidate division Zixibacteria bacterium]
MDTSVSELKKRAAVTAADMVEDGMIVGLGHGSTALFAVQRIAERIKAGELRDITGVPCSLEMGDAAQALGIPLTTLDDHPDIDLTIDGADEVDPHLNVIKGGGGALLREKIVAQVTNREIIVVDESKLSPVLGTQWAVPVEVIPFGQRTHQRFLESLGAQVTLRTTTDGSVFQTDQGNVILDANFGPIGSPEELGAELDCRTGIVAHGLFLGLAERVIVAGAKGDTVMTLAEQEA